LLGSYVNNIYVCGMSLTQAKQKVKDRRDYVYKAYVNKPADLAVTTLVNTLSKKYKVSTVTIFGDIKKMKG